MYGPKIAYQQCNGCKLCYEECPTDVFSWDKERERPIVLYPNECNSCGACELDCMQLAIEIILPSWLQLTYAKKVK